MALTTGIRIVIGAVYVDFYREEVEDIVFKPLVEYMVLEGHKQAPDLIKIGSTQSMIEMSFTDWNSATKAKVDQVVNADCEMTLYYQYAYDPTVYKNVIVMAVDDVKKTTEYFNSADINYGRVKTRYSLTFAEC